MDAVQCHDNRARNSINNVAPDILVANKVATTKGQVFSESQFVTAATDANGDPIVRYRFWDDNGRSVRRMTIRPRITPVTSCSMESGEQPVSSDRSQRVRHCQLRVQDHERHRHSLGAGL